MKIGNLTSLENGPVRDVEVRISPEQIYSAIAEPPGVILGEHISSYDLIEELRGGIPYIHLRINVSSGEAISFYTGNHFDVTLLLDELDASLGERPRGLKDAEQSPSLSESPTSFDKDEMLRGQVISKIHWGAQEEEVAQWLEEEKGIVGRAADELLRTAWRERRKAIRIRAVMTLFFSVLGLTIAALSISLIVVGGWVWTGYGTFLGLTLGVTSVFWIFKSLYHLLTAKDIGPVD